MKTVTKSLLIIFVIFLFPASLSLAWWYFADRPQSWRNADWGSSGLLPPASENKEAVIHVMAARTGGLKGALSVHSWIVTKRKGQARYDRYDKVGWGRPVRKNEFPADGLWYSNEPFFVKTVRGIEAERLIPEVETAIESYMASFPNGYRLWPGPNSNSFVAHVLREVTQLDAILPSNAVGRDYLAGSGITVDRDGRDYHLSLFGLAGVAFGLRSGFEVHLLGLVAGIDVLRPGIKIPAIGRVGL
ncbi:MAG: DUF3750 domain-containing protein [Rhizobiaceae bacterium]